MDTLHILEWYVCYFLMVLIIGRLQKSTTALHGTRFDCLLTDCLLVKFQPKVNSL